MNIQCPHCGQDYEVEKTMYGKNVRCETCGKKFVAGVADARQNQTEATCSAPAASAPKSERLEPLPKPLPTIQPRWLGRKVFIAVLLANIVCASIFTSVLAKAIANSITDEVKREFTYDDLINKPSFGVILDGTRYSNNHVYLPIK